MVLQLAALAGLLFAGLKKTETIIHVEGQYLAKNDPMAEDVTVFASDAEVAFVPPLTAALQTAKNEAFYRTHAAALSALALSTAGFAYAPLAVLSLPFVLYAFRDLFKITYLQLQNKKITTYTLITLVTLGTFFISGGFFLASLVAVLFIWSIRLTDMMTEKSRQNIADLFEKTPEYVWLVVNNAEVKTPYAQIQRGDIVVVQAGNPIPVDGIIVEGMATVDQHILTGEAQPVEKEAGDAVFSSTILLAGKIYVRVEQAGADTTVAKITQILNNTVDFKSSVQMRSERLSQELVMPALVGGIVAAPLLGLNGALAVINSHPKERMAFVAPISTLNYINIAILRNILIKDGRSLELINTVDTVVFDKTGTLTEERPMVGKIHALPPYDNTMILALAAAAEHRQTHPLAKAIIEAAEQAGIVPPPLEEGEYKVGFGVAVRVVGRKIRVGSARFMTMEGLEIPQALRQDQQEASVQGHTLVLVAIDGQVYGCIQLLPRVRPEALTVLQYLKKLGKKTCIISGDHETPTRNLAQQLGVDQYFAQVLPQDKAAIIEQLQAQGHVVCYVGDGINDSIALKQAQVSISLGNASTLAQDTAAIILMDHGISHLPELFTIAERYKKNMDITLLILLTPAVIGLGGVFLLHYGLAQTIALNLLGLVGGVANAMWPVLQGEGVKPASPPAEV